MKLALTIAVLLAVAIANAGSISITTTADTLVMNSTSAVLPVTVRNSGDEAAHDVKISLLLPDGFTSQGVFAGRIEPGSSYTTDFSIAGDAKSGEYAYAILVEYKDANRYPFSAVSPNAIVYKIPSSSHVTATLRGTAMQENGSIIMSIRNRDAVPHEIKVKLYLPNEIASMESEKTIALAGNENRQESFVLENQGALDGSNYAVFAVISYENGEHYSHIASSNVRIGAETATTRPQTDGVKVNDMLMILLALLIAVLVIYNIGVKKWKKKEQKQEQV